MAEENQFREHVRDLLEWLGDNPGRDGLCETPRRVEKMFREMTYGLREPAPHITLFDAEGLDQMVTILGIDYSSLCEHHLLPFYGRVHVGYLPGEKLIGLSKFGRLVDWISHRPQIQEAMTVQIADFILEKAEPQGVIVVVEGVHLCMEIRGVKKTGHKTVTSAIRGDVPKEEFFDILKFQR